MLSGCTTTTDHHYVFPTGLENAIDIEVGVARRLGMRAVLTRGSMNLSERDGGLPPDGVVQDEDTILEDSRRLIETHHQRGDGAMVQIALAPCSPFSVTRSLMTRTAELAERHDVRLHTHLAETEDENAFCLETLGRRPLDYLEDCGWLSDRVWLAHGIHFTPRRSTAWPPPGPRSPTARAATRFWRPACVPSTAWSALASRWASAWTAPPRPTAPT